MTSIVLTGASLQIQPSLATTKNSIPAAAAQTEVPAPSTQLTLAQAGDATSPVYAKPQPPASKQAWSGPSNDRISRLMLENFNTQQHGLLAQTKGLGAALLAGFATGQTNYRQTFSSYNNTENIDSSEAARTQELNALDTARLASSRVSLQIQTRSGQTVQLQIAFKNGLDGQNTGLHIEVSSSGQLSDSERKAVAELAEGFDKVLAGLGQSKGPELDLADMLAYDRSELAGISLTVQDYAADAHVPSFSLQLNDQQRTLNMRLPQGESVSDLSLNLNPATPLLGSSAQQREASIAEILQQLDASVRRSHADEALVTLFKQAFTQLQKMDPPSSDAATVPSNKLDALLQRKVPGMLSGLMDYEASFSGDFTHQNSKGELKESGKARHEISQSTQVQKNSQTNSAIVLQRQSEKIDAQYMKARGAGALEPEKGNYDDYTIQDQTLRTTLITAVDGVLTQAKQRIDVNLQLHVTSLVNSKVQSQRSVPVHKQLIKQLL